MTDKAAIVFAVQQNVSFGFFTAYERSIVDECFFDDVFLLPYKKRYVYSYVSFFENSSYLRAVVLIMIENIQKTFYL